MGLIASICWLSVDAATKSFWRVPFCESDGCSAAEVFDEWIQGALILTRATLSATIVSGNADDSGELATLRIGDALESMSCRSSSPGCSSIPEPCLTAFDVTNYIMNSTALTVGFDTSVNTTACIVAIEYVLDLVYEDPPPTGMVSENTNGAKPVSRLVDSRDVGLTFSLDGPVSSARLTAEIKHGDLVDPDKLALIQIGSDPTNLYTIASCRTNTPCPETAETCFASYDVISYINESTSSLDVMVHTPDTVDVSCGGIVIGVQFTLEYVSAPTSAPSPRPSEPPTPGPTSPGPTASPTHAPTAAPTSDPSLPPTPPPSVAPNPIPTNDPTPQDIAPPPTRIPNDSSNNPNTSTTSIPTPIAIVIAVAVPLAVGIFLLYFKDFKAYIAKKMGCGDADPSPSQQLERRTPRRRQRRRTRRLR